MSTDDSLAPASAPSPQHALQPPLSGHSRFALRLRRRYAVELELLPQAALDRATMAVAFERLLARGDSVATALRILRQLVLERLIRLDCDEQAPLALVTRAMTHLAEFALDRACTEACRQLDAQHGGPLGPTGERARLWVVGMGKLGARELNVSSDIDLIYVYDQELRPLIAPMRTGTPKRRVAWLSSVGRSSPIRGTIQPYSAPQASTSTSQKATRSHHSALATAQNARNGPEGDGESFMETRMWQELSPPVPTPLWRACPEFVRETAS